MSDNPFDVFAADFKAAIPTTDEKNGGNASNQPINIMAEPAPAPVPVMNAPAAAPVSVMNQQPPQMNAQSMNQNMYGGGMGMNNMSAAPYGAPPAGQGALVPSAQQSNPYAVNMGGMPYGAPPQMGAPPPTMGMPPAPMYQMDAPSMGMAPAPMYGAPPMGMAPPAPAPYGMPSGPPPGQAPVPPPGQMPYSMGAPPQPESAPAPPAVPAPAPTMSADPFATGPPSPVPVGQMTYSTLPPQPEADSFLAGLPPQPDATDPFYAPHPQPEATDPWNQSAPPVSHDALVPALAGNDPFMLFEQSDAISVATNPAQQAPYTQKQVAEIVDGVNDPWNNTFGSSPNNASVTSASVNANPEPTPTNNGGGGSLLEDNALVPVAEEMHKSGELPPGGEWYDARIFTPTLGVMFFKPQELTDSLFLQTDRSLVDSLDDRPVVAFIVEGSSARAAGVELGHVLLKVNGIDVKNPKEASRLIKEGPRPLPLLFYVPDTTVVVAEGEHMVKYDTRETMAPNSAKDWKPKYCVIGGIIAQPWMMNMYRSKSEYDIAVIETQARRPVSVKVKQFSLQGARVQNDWQGPQMVKYKNKLHPWKYIVILPISRNPIKISSPNLGQLKPVHEGIRRVLMAQNRYAPSPRNDPYGGQQPQQPPPAPAGQQAYGQHGGGGGGGQYGGHPQQQQPPLPPQPQQQGYAGYSGGGQTQDQYSTSGGTASARRRTPQY